MESAIKQVHEATHPIVESTSLTPSTPSVGVKTEGSARFQTPSATTKMEPISPQISTKSESAAMPIAGIDLNSHFLDNDCGNLVLHRKVVAKVGRFARSHWENGHEHPERDATVTHILFDWLSTTCSDELQK
jgi:hypothetical protein